MNWQKPPCLSFRAQRGIYAQRGEKVDEGEYLFEPRECCGFSVQTDYRNGASSTESLRVDSSARLGMTNKAVFANSLTNSERVSRSPETSEGEGPEFTLSALRA